jgi:uncharacterized protein YehS (DUF1456 family)
VTHNDTLDRLRATLKLTDAEVLKCFTLVGRTLTTEAQAGLGAQVQGESRTLLTDALLADFLDGLIIARRGPSPSSSGSRDAVVELTNNMILKKLRIALNLQAEDMLKLFHRGGKTLAKGELSALFRKSTHKHYKACDDEHLSAFLEGVKKSEGRPTR